MAAFVDPRKKQRTRGTSIRYGTQFTLIDRGLRIRGMLADRCLGAVIGRDPPTSFDTWLRDYVGDDGATHGQLAVVDLPLVPSEVIHIVVAGACAL